MRKKLIFMALSALLLLVSSCGSSDGKGGYDAVPFQETEKGMWGMITIDGKVLFKDEFKEKPTMSKEGMFMVKNDKGLWEIYTAEEKPKKVGTEYVSATLFTDGIALVAEQNKPVSIIDKEGKTVKTLDKVDGKEVSAVRAFVNGYAVYKTGDNYGVIDEDGKGVIPAKYCRIKDCSDGKFLAIDAKYRKELDADSATTGTLKYTVLDTKGKVVTELSQSKFSDIAGSFTDGLLPVEIEKEGEKICGIINEKGEYEVKPSSKYKGISDISDGKFIYYNGTACGVMDLKGETVIRAKYDKIMFDSKGKFLTYTNGNDGKDNYKFVDSEDNQIGSDTYQDAIPFFVFDGKHTVVKVSDSQWAIIDSEGKQLDKLPDMVNISYSTGDNVVESDYVNFTALFEEINISENGMDGLTFSSSPLKVVKALSDYLSSTKEHPVTDPYWYDYRSSFSYYHAVNNVVPTFEVSFTGVLSRQTYTTRRVVDYTFYDGSQWYHDEKVPTGYAWNDVKVNGFGVTIDNSGKMKGKLRMLLNAAVTRFSHMGRVVKQNNGAAVITLRNGKSALIYMTPKKVCIAWGEIGNASSIDISKYKDVKENTDDDSSNDSSYDYSPDYSDDDAVAADTDVVACEADSFVAA